MTFSKSERDLVQHLVDKDYEWLRNKYYHDAPGYFEEWNKKDKLILKRKLDNYRQRISKIKKKVKQMEDDLNLYHNLSERGIQSTWKPSRLSESSDLVELFY